MRPEVVESLSVIPKVQGKNAKDPVEFELEIQTQRILTTLQYCLNKLRIMACLPMFLDNPDLLHGILDHSDINLLAASCIQFEPLHGFSSDDNIPSSSEKKSVVSKASRSKSSKASKISTAISVISSGEKVEKQSTKSSLKTPVELQAPREMVQTDFHMSRLMHVITDNNKLLTWMRKEEPDIGDLEKEFIKYFGELKRFAQENMFIPFAEQVRKENALRDSYKMDHVLIQGTEELKEKIENVENTLGKEYKANSEKLEAILKEIDTATKHYNEDIKKTIYGSEKTMMLEYMESKERLPRLVEEGQQSVDHFEALLDANVKEEMTLRADKIKVETALGSWLATYDNDVGVKFAELDQIREHTKEIKQKYETLKEKYEIQNETYVILMEEKRIEDERLNEDKAYQFLLNRAARRLQRGWRAFIARRWERKRAKKIAKIEKKIRKEMKKEQKKEAKEQRIKKSKSNVQEGPRTFTPKVKITEEMFKPLKSMIDVN